jgi:hypothetical protein
MRTPFLFILTIAGVLAVTDDVSAFGRKAHRAEVCCYGDVQPVEVAHGGTVSYSTGVVIPIGVVLPSSTSYRYYPNGGIWPTGYDATMYPGNGIFPAPGLIETKTPVAPRLYPLPTKDK